jgi:hypothetical protein
LTLIATAAGQVTTAYEGFGDYAAGAQLESGSNGSSGTPLDGGLGWGGPYDVNNAIKSLVRAENRSSSPVVYSNGEVVIHGGDRAMRLYDVANGSYVWQRPLEIPFQAAAGGGTLWFSFLFRSNNGSPLANRDYFHIGFDDNPQAQNGTPRAGIGVTTIESTFPPNQPFRFFAKSTISDDTMVFAETEAASVTTYLLVGRIAATAGTYDVVDLFLNPSSMSDPGPPAATASVDSGLTTLTHCFLRTSGLDAGDAYVLDELKIGESYASVVAPPPFELRFDPGGTPVLRWSALLGPTVLQSTSSLEEGNWLPVVGPFATQGTEFVFPIPPETGSRQFYRLRQP